jgi:hypothetical protein
MASEGIGKGGGSRIDFERGDQARTFFMTSSELEGIRRSCYKCAIGLSLFSISGEDEEEKS